MEDERVIALHLSTLGLSITAGRPFSDPFKFERYSTWVFSMFRLSL
jgi:hypothetical protein